ncbi:MAG: Dam family site-specific DNA-(adenine-N6)-methyltransferase [Alphaproteobacteria bacterium]|nr:Dam family site-specific DNA-(adenine-N6)-methyltransferase [Alphaproteobacteria bacterium]
MKPLLKWAGGKARLAPEICEAFAGPCSGTYLEPFAGAAAVALFRLQRGDIGDAVLTDVNHKLIAVHAAVRDHVDDVLEELAAMPYDDWKERYYQVRAAYNDGPFKGPAHAARFIWLNRAGFNGLYRENKRGEHNVPVGRYTRVSIPDESHFRKVSELLRGVHLSADDFRTALTRAGKGDQVYCDPPYVPLSATANFTAYCKAPFGLPEQIALAEAARDAASRGAQVVLSNHDTPLVRDRIYRLDRGFRFHSTPEVSRAISRKGDSRVAVSEVIAAIGPIAA